MKVLQICSKPPVPAIDGGCKAMNNITKGLLQQQVDVKVLTVSTFKHPFLKTKMSAEYIKSTQIEHVEIDIKVKAKDAFLNLFTDKSYNVERFYSSLFEQLILDALQKENYDIVFLESLFVTPYLDKIRANSAAKIVYRAHNVEHEIWFRNATHEKNKIKKNYLNLLAKRLKKYETNVLNAVDGIASISERDKEQLINLGAKTPIEVIPFGFDITQYFKENELKKEANFFHIGSMDWEPNQEGIKWFLENVWGKVSEKHPNINFNLAGKSMPDWLKNWKQKNVTIFGEVADALQFIKENDVMIVPLFVGSGMRIKIIEGMALGKPVIATAVAAEGIHYKNETDIVIANTANEFILQLDKMLENGSYANQIGKQAKNTITTYYDNNVIVNNLLQFFKQLNK